MSAAAQPARPPLSRDSVLRAALAIVDREGPEKLTMRRLGGELGVDPMAVYRHVPNKSALFDGITEVIWGSVDVDGIDVAGTWRDELVGVMRSLRDALRAHPRAVVILGTRPVAGPELFALLERMLGRLAAAGMPANADAAELLNILVTYTTGHVLAEAGEPVGGETDQPSDPGLSLSTHPHLAAVLADGWEHDPDRAYERGLRAFVDGWRRAPEPGERPW
ncbi:TetR family transcriptional regulator [Nocardiopsis sp. Huas11]|uniref:TetR/AcrR family transcriptional regulator n=1 Tax=Nocardiopsis sp. Huas11 TaxID=2183912 RepID=UPI000EB0D7C9|nr:TetR/AcrR family transcriptional regulator [Nocardiopsis sp. Huas11]RKS05918.1 TetR family transcriptional regulator [Nocardiopsis sp. Huas11]